MENTKDRKPTRRGFKRCTKEVVYELLCHQEFWVSVKDFIDKYNKTL